jgi:hypothetical protein
MQKQAPQWPKLVVDLDLAQGGVAVSASIATPQTAATARTVVPWWLVGCAVAGGIAGATIARIQNEAEEQAERERRARLRRARQRRRLAA